MRSTLRIGTRASRLARWQAEWIAGRLCDFHPGLNVELVNIRTDGDRDQSSSLTAIGGIGLFTKEIQRALIDQAVDIAVHSLKDLPTLSSPDLTLAAVPEREDVADALISPRFRSLNTMLPGARVGTSSLRRRAQVLHLFPSLQVVPIRGNVETRLNLALEGKLDGVILALAGLKRLGLESSVTERLEPDYFLPAVGQGALGLECRATDSQTQALLQPLDCAESHQAVLAERSVLASFGGGCLIPMGAWARHFTHPAQNQRMLALDASVFDPDGRARVSASCVGPCTESLDLGCQVAEALQAQGAQEILARASSQGSVHRP